MVMGKEIEPWKAARAVPGWLGGGRRTRRKARLDIIPLVDVLTILIFFFLMSMRFQEESALDITLPQIETAGPVAVSEGLVIQITAEGKLFLGREASPVEMAELRQFLRRLEGTGGRLPVLLLADEETPLKTVTAVMDACRAVGLDRIRLQSRSRGE